MNLLTFRSRRSTDTIRDTPPGPSFLDLPSVTTISGVEPGVHGIANDLLPIRPKNQSAIDDQRARTSRALRLVIHDKKTGHVPTDEIETDLRKISMAITTKTERDSRYHW